jgi:hypothetical protein
MLSVGAAGSEHSGSKLDLDQTVRFAGADNGLGVAAEERKGELQCSSFRKASPIEIS